MRDGGSYERLRKIVESCGELRKVLKTLENC